MTPLLWPAVLRLAMLVAAYGAVSSVSEAGQRPLTNGVTVLFMLIAAVAAVWPDSFASLPFLLVYGWYWAARVETPVSGWALPAAIALSAYHTAAAMASLAPWKAPADRAVVVRWAVRLAAVVGVTVAVWGAARVLDSSRRDGHAVLFGIALLVLAVATWVVAAASRPSNQPEA